jgi:HK97 gp10 family phage protein
MAIKVRNRDRLFQALRKSVPAVDAELRAALAKAGDQFVDTAQSLVPYDDGDLHDSIGWAWTKNTQKDASRSPAIVVFAGGDPGKAGLFSRFKTFFGMGARRPTGSGAYYVRFVEFGTPDTPKQPFFFPSYRLVRRKIRGQLSRAIGKAIKKSGLGK